MEKQRGKRQAEVTLKDGNLLTKKDTTAEETAAEKFISFTAAGLIRPFFKEMGDFFPNMQSNYSDVHHDTWDL